MLKNPSLALIRDSVWFKVLSPDTHESMLANCVEKSFEKDCRIIARGEQPKGLYGVISGKARICGADSKGNASTLMILIEGHWFGEISCIDNLPCVHDVITVEPCTLLFIPKAIIQQLMADNPTFHQAITFNLCYRLRQSLSIIEQTNTQSLPARLASRLLSLSCSDQLKGDYDAFIKDNSPKTTTISVSQQDLADMLGVSRQSVSKVINGWKNDKLINIDYGTITLLDIATLKTLASPTLVPL